MQIITKIAKGIWKISIGSNAYFLDFHQKIIIDTGPRSSQSILKSWLGKLVDFREISFVYLTHLHYDHSGNIDLFPNTRVFAGKEEIEYFKKDSESAVLGKKEAKILKKANLEPAKSVCGLKVISVPGHSHGSIALWLEKESILFSGDTLFLNGYGRTDLPGSRPKLMSKSIEKLKELNARIICPGHDY